MPTQNTITIKYEGIQQQIPVTCSQKLDPTRYTVIDPVDELELGRYYSSSIL
jgi:hypothetical protein